MLRRRIFSSAMASVMALSTVAVVAQAEETKAVKSYEDLDKLINGTYGSDYRADELATYGETSAAWMLDALEAADAILYNSKSTEADYTVAYYMVVATEKKLERYTADQLEKLIKKCVPYTADGNIYNEELQDLRYDADAYGAFEEAIENAEMYVTSESSTEITEAFVKLNGALENLLAKELTPVTKTEFRAVLKQYEAILEDEFAYDSWRRGTIGWAGDVTDAWLLQNKVATFGAMYDIAMEAQLAIEDAYSAIDEIKGISKTTNPEIRAGYDLAKKVVSFFNAWTPDSSSRATKSGVSALLKDYHGQLVYNFTGTSTNELFEAIKAVSADDTKIEIFGKSAPTVEVPDVLWALAHDSAVSSKLVSAEAVIKNKSETVYVPVDADGYWVSSADIQTVKPVKGVAGMKNGTGNELANAADYWVIADGTGYAIADSKTAVYKYQQISKNTKFDLADLIKVTAEDVKDAGGTYSNEDNNAVWDQGSEFEDVSGWGTTLSSLMGGDVSIASDYIVDLSKAMAIAEAYLAKEYNAELDDAAGGVEYLGATGIVGDFANAIESIDETGIVAANEAASATSKEWQLVYRYLEYALTDLYAGSATKADSHTRAQVEALIEDCYELSELTGEAAIFNTSHMAMVEARQEAKAWVAASKSDKLYKEGKEGTDADGQPYISSEAQYTKLWGTYDTLNKELATLNLSYQEVYDKIAEAAELIDDGTLNGTTDLIDAIEATAAALSAVDDVTFYNDGAGEYLDNYAFTDEREFVGINRLVTADGNVADLGNKITLKANSTHKTLGDAYAALEAAMEKAKEPEVVVVAGDYDGNGSLELDDAIAIIDAVLENGGVAIADTKGDMDGDGDTDLEDAIAIIDAKFAELLG